MDSFARMRTTLDIDDEILELARSHARERNISVGAALSDLARRGLHRLPDSRESRNGFPLFGVSQDSTPLTLDRVKRHEDNI